MEKIFNKKWKDQADEDAKTDHDEKQPIGKRVFHIAPEKVRKDRTDLLMHCKTIHPMSGESQIINRVNT